MSQKRDVSLRQTSTKKKIPKDADIFRIG